MKILVDVCLTPAWTDFLHAHGYEVKHWSATGLPSAKDEEIVEFAATHGYTILTYDLDFGSILAHRNPHFPSVIQLRYLDPVPRVNGQGLIRALEATELRIEQGALISIDERQHRVRALPMRS